MATLLIVIISEHLAERRAEVGDVGVDFWQGWGGSTCADQYWFARVGDSSGKLGRMRLAAQQRVCHVQRHHALPLALVPTVLEATKDKKKLLAPAVMSGH